MVAPLAVPAVPPEEGPLAPADLDAAPEPPAAPPAVRWSLRRAARDVRAAIRAVCE